MWRHFSFSKKIWHTRNLKIKSIFEKKKNHRFNHTLYKSRITIWRESRSSSSFSFSSYHLNEEYSNVESTYVVLKISSSFTLLFESVAMARSKCYIWWSKLVSIRDIVRSIPETYSEIDIYNNNKKKLKEKLDFHNSHRIQLTRWNNLDFQFKIRQTTDFSRILMREFFNVR